ncbi:MAG: hypothetical protein ACRD0G_09650 [Acidimicrobiales bacterium]
MERGVPEPWIDVVARGSEHASGPRATPETKADERSVTIRIVRGETVVPQLPDLLGGLASGDMESGSGLGKLIDTAYQIAKLAGQVSGPVKTGVDVVKLGMIPITIVAEVGREAKWMYVNSAFKDEAAKALATLTGRGAGLQHAYLRFGQQRREHLGKLVDLDGDVRTSEAPLGASNVDVRIRATAQRVVFDAITSMGPEKFDVWLADVRRRFPTDEARRRYFQERLGVGMH